MALSHGQRAPSEFNIGSRDAASSAEIPPSVPGYDDRRNVFIQMPDRACLNGANKRPAPVQMAAPGSPDSGLGSSSSGSSDGVPDTDHHEYSRPSYQRQMARRGRLCFSSVSNSDKRQQKE